MQYIPGIMPDDIAYATDTFWPAIYTQLGVIGFLLYVIILVLIFRYFFMQNKEQERFLWAGMLLLLYGLMASVFEAFYTNDSGVFTIIFMMLLMRSRQYSSDTLFETEKEHE